MLGSKRNRNGVEAQAIQFIFVLMPIAAILGSIRSTVAGSASAPLSITATVMRTCRLSPNPLAFENYDPVVTNANTAPTASANMTVVCSRGSNPTILISVGTHPPATIALDAIPNGSPPLRYENQKDSGSMQAGPVSENRVISLGTIPSLGPKTVPAYGRVPAGQNVSAGSYNDTVTVTVNF
jgi:spore coat protein U-like protein